MNGKGSKIRPTNLKQFQENWDEINWASEAQMVEAIDKHSKNSKKQFDALPPASKQRALDIIKKTQPMVDARESALRKEAEKDANAPESTVEGMIWAMETLMAGYKGDRK